MANSDIWQEKRVPFHMGMSALARRTIPLQDYLLRLA